MNEVDNTRKPQTDIKQAVGMVTNSVTQESPWKHPGDR